MIREDRELLAELARLNSDMASLGLRVMEGIAGAAEQQHYAQRLVAAGERLQRRADGISDVVIEGRLRLRIRSSCRRIPLNSIGNNEQCLDDAVPAPAGIARGAGEPAQR